MLYIINIYYYIMENMKNLIYFISKQIQFPTVQNNITKELYIVTPQTLLSTFILSIIFLYVFWSEVESKTILFSWFTIVTILSFTRYYDLQQYLKKKKESYKKWYILFKTKAILNSFLWGITPFLFFTDISHFHQLVLLGG